MRCPASIDRQESVEYDPAHPGVMAEVTALKGIARTTDFPVRQSLASDGAALNHSVVASEKAVPDQATTKDSIRKKCASTLMRVVCTDSEDSDDEDTAESAKSAKSGGLGQRAEDVVTDCDSAALWVAGLNGWKMGREIIEHLAHMAALIETNDLPTESPVTQVVDWRRAYCHALGRPLATPWGMPHKPPKYVMIANINGKRVVLHGRSPMLFQMFAHTPPMHGAHDQGVEGMKDLIKYLGARPHLHGLMTYSLVYQGGYNSLHWEARTVERKEDGRVIDGHMCLRIDDVSPSPAHCTSTLESAASGPILKAIWEEMEENLQAHDIESLARCEESEDHNDHVLWVSEKVEKCRNIIASMQQERNRNDSVHQAVVRKLEKENILLGHEVAALQKRESAREKGVVKGSDAKLSSEKGGTEVERRKLRRDRKLCKGSSRKAQEELASDEPPDPPLQPQQGTTYSEHWRMCADKIAWQRERLEDMRVEAAGALHELAERNCSAGEADLRIMQERDNALERVKELEVLLLAEKQRSNSESTKATNANRDLDQHKERLASANRKTIDDLERKVQDAQMQERTARADAAQCLDRLRTIDRQLDGKDAEQDVLNKHIHELQRTVFRLKCVCMVAGAKYASRLGLLKDEYQKNAEANQTIKEVRKEHKAKVGGIERTRTSAVARADKLQSDLHLSRAALDDLRCEMAAAQKAAVERVLEPRDNSEAIANKKKKKGPPPPDLLEGDGAEEGFGKPSALMRMQMELGELNNRVVSAEQELVQKTLLVGELNNRADSAEQELVRKTLLLTRSEEFNSQLLCNAQSHKSETEMANQTVTALMAQVSNLNDQVGAKHSDEKREAELGRALAQNANHVMGSAGLELVIKQAHEHLQLLGTMARCAESTDRSNHAK